MNNNVTSIVFATVRATGRRVPVQIAVGQTVLPAGMTTVDEDGNVYSVLDCSFPSGFSIAF